MALVVVASETPAEQWEPNIGDLLFDLGWRDREDPYRDPGPESPTLDVLRLLAGETRTGRRSQGVNTAVAAIARAVIRV